MFKITILGEEQYDDEKSEFFQSELATLELEHSLVSLSKWESFWEKPFLGKDDKTDEETLWYVNAMIQNDYEPEVLSHLSPKNLEDVNKYISKKMSATWFAEDDTPEKPGKKEVVTAEVIYYWMIALNIPWECQHWHLNRLLTLIKVVNAKQAPEKKEKLAPATAASRRRALNEARRAKSGSKG